MSKEQKVDALKKELEKAIAQTPIAEDKAMSVLKRISEIEFDFKLLKATMIHVVVKKVSKEPSSSGALRDSAKTLINNFKKLVSEQKKSRTSTGAADSATSTPSASKPSLKSSSSSTSSASLSTSSSRTKPSLSSPSTSGRSTPVTSRPVTKTISKPVGKPLSSRPIAKTLSNAGKPPGAVTNMRARANSIDHSAAYHTGDPNRDQSIKLFCGVFKKETETYGSNIGKISADLEKAVYEHFNKQTTPDYKATVRSRRALINSNPELRVRILKKELSLDTLVTAKPEDLEGEAMKKARKEAKEQAIADATVAKRQMATTTEFTCGKCKNNLCKFFEMQIRSADEPMTMFVYCCTPGCGNRWKN